MKLQELPLTRVFWQPRKVEKDEGWGGRAVKRRREPESWKVGETGKKSDVEREVMRADSRERSEDESAS